MGRLGGALGRRCCGLTEVAVQHFLAGGRGPAPSHQPRLKITQLSAKARARWMNCSMSTTAIPDLAGLLQALEDLVHHQGRQARGTSRRR